MPLNNHCISLKSAKEEWRPVIGYEGKYEVSNIGRVKSLINNAIMIPNYKIRYAVVTLSRPRRQWRIHRLVAMSFIDNPNNYPHINHIDGIKTNNLINNLEWCTPKQNICHAVRTGLYKPPEGEKHGNHLLSDEKVRELRQSCADGKFKYIKEAAKYYGISKENAMEIVRGKRRRSAGGPILKPCHKNYLICRKFKCTGLGVLE